MQHFLPATWAGGANLCPSLEKRASSALVQVRAGSATRRAPGLAVAEAVRPGVVSASPGFRAGPVRMAWDRAVFSEQGNMPSPELGKL